MSSTSPTLAALKPNPPLRLKKCLDSAFLPFSDDGLARNTGIRVSDATLWNANSETDMICSMTCIVYGFCNETGVSADSRSPTVFNGEHCGASSISPSGCSARPSLLGVCIVSSR